MSTSVSNAPEVKSAPRKDSQAEWGSAVDRAKARDAGIEWQRPSDDNRSAQQIIDETPLLKNLGNQSGVKDKLKERVGDFERDADAAYRAVQVLNHVERFDESGSRLVGDDINNDQINGFSKSGDAYHGTEAGRLQDFGKYGWGNLKGELQHVHAVSDDAAAREQAEAAGIQWQLPEGDKRSAKDIIDANPLLKNLGNQSFVKDMLKERVGDFEHDADAAHRAIQVLDRVVGFDGDGKPRSGKGVANTSIDGFTKSGEAKHGSEAGRLQDFGKYGFEALPKAQAADQLEGYKSYLETNPDADAGSKLTAQYAAIVQAKFDSIAGKTGAGSTLTQQNIKDYLRDNPQLSEQEKEALNFFSQPGAFKLLDTAAKPLAGSADGKVSSKDVNSWLSTLAPTDAQSLTDLLSTVAAGNVTSKVDTSKLGEDVFKNPDKYSAEQKAAVLLDLQAAQKLVLGGAQAGMWGDDYGKVAIANRSGAVWEPEKLMQDISEHISILQNDKPTAQYLKKAGDEAIKTLFKENPGLKDATTKTYEDQVKSGKALDKAWEAATVDGKTDQTAALTQFYATASSLQSMLGIDDPKAIQAAVGKSAHGDDFKDFYKNQLASGDRLRELMKTHTPEQAVAAFSMEAALYNAALDPAFTGRYDQQLNDNFSSIVQENLFKDASFDDLKTAFGKDGSDELDEDKVRKLVEQMRSESPELLMNQDGSVATADQIVAGFRGNWDMLRQGTKALDKFDRLEKFDPNGSAKGAYGSGVLHGVSGLFLSGVTIARGVQNGNKLTDRNIVDIATGSVQTASLFIEGGTKGYQTHLSTAISNGEQSLKDIKDGKLPGDLLDQIKGNVKDNKNAALIAKNFEEAAKGIGGLAGVAAGAYGIFDGVGAIRRGDTLTGGFSITAGSLAVLAGSASALEGGLGLLGANLPRFLPALAGAAGVLGFLGAGVAALGAFIPALVKEGQQQEKASTFGSVLGDAIERYGIDGVKDGTIDDIPIEDWPGGEEWTS